MLDPERYSINYVHDSFFKDEINPPSKASAGQFFDVLNALYLSHKSGGRESAKNAWKVLRRAEPRLDKRKKLWTIRELQHLKPPEYALSPNEENNPFYAVYLKGLNVIYGKPGSCKTFIAMDFLNRLALARPDMNVVFAAGEGVADLYSRQMAWEKHNGHQIDNIHIYDEALPLLQSEGVEDFVLWVNDIQPSFIVIDTLARAMLGENENDTAIMSEFIAQCDNLMRQLDCGILLVHHTNRMGYMRGSIALDGGADSILKVHAEDNHYIVYNSLDNGGKNKYALEAPAVHLSKISIDLKDTKSSAVMVLSNKVIEDIEGDRPLTDNQLNICLTLRGREYLTAKGIGEMSNITKSTIYRNIKTLLSGGFVAQPFPEAYKLTDKGDAYLESI